MSVRQLPAFASEAEEAAWWYDNREQLDQEFAKAVEEGRVRRTSLAQRLTWAKHTVMVGLSEEDATAAKLLAEKRGVEVYLLLSELLHRAILKEMERAA